MNLDTAKNIELGRDAQDYEQSVIEYTDGIKLGAMMVQNSETMVLLRETKPIRPMKKDGPPVPGTKTVKPTPIDEFFRGERNDSL